MLLLRSFLRRHFAGKPVVASRKVGCFLRLIPAIAIRRFNLLRFCPSALSFVFTKLHVRSFTVLSIFFYLYARLAMGGFFLNCSTTVSKVSLISYLFNYNLNRNNAVCYFCFSPERRTSENNGSLANQTQTRKSVSSYITRDKLLSKQSQTFFERRFIF